MTERASCCFHRIHRVLPQNLYPVASRSRLPHPGILPRRTVRANYRSGVTALTGFPRSSQKVIKRLILLSWLREVLSRRAIGAMRFSRPCQMTPSTRPTELPSTPPTIAKAAAIMSNTPGDPPPSSGMSLGVNVVTRNNKKPAKAPKNNPPRVHCKIRKVLRPF
jgi:hypothetical protein